MRTIKKMHKKTPLRKRGTYLKAIRLDEQVIRQVNYTLCSDTTKIHIFF